MKKSICSALFVLPLLAACPGRRGEVVSLLTADSERLDRAERICHVSVEDGAIVGKTAEGTATRSLHQQGLWRLYLEFEVKCDPKLNSACSSAATSIPRRPRSKS